MSSALAVDLNSAPGAAARNTECHADPVDRRLGQWGDHRFSSLRRTSAMQSLRMGGSLSQVCAGGRPRDVAVDNPDNADTGFIVLR